MRRALASLVVLASACGAQPSAEQPRDPEARPAPPWAGATGDHWLPGPWTSARAAEDRSALEAECRGCHVEIAREWAGSQHAGSWSSAAFQAAFRVEPLKFCQGCHAPEVSPREEVPSWAADIGTGCVTCHVEPGTGRIWGPTSRASSDDAHEVLGSPAFAGPAACAACHEFEFPDAAVRERSLLMQSTIGEHAASRFADRSCADCHMPEVGAPGQRHRSHAFAGAYDQEMLARALVIDARREPDRLILRLEPGEVGHAVPTGDLLRRLELRVEVFEDDGEPRLLARRWLGRRFAPIQQHNGLTVRGQLEDTRVGPEGRTIEIPLSPDLADQPIRWTLLHQRVAHASPDPLRARIEGQLELASGVE